MKVLVLFQSVILASLVGSIPPAAAQEKPSLEIGAQLLSFSFLKNKGEGGLTTINNPGTGIFSQPSIYASLFLLNKLAFEPQLAFNSVSVDDESVTLLGLGGRFAYLFRGAASNSSPYFSADAAIVRASASSDFGDDAESQFGAGMSIGYRAVVQDRMALRFETRYKRWFESNTNETILMLSFGVVLGGEKPRPVWKPRPVGPRAPAPATGTEQVEDAEGAAEPSETEHFPEAPKQVTPSRTRIQPGTPEVVVLSEQLGEIIDGEERKRYGLFGNIERFVSAIYFRLPDGNHTVRLVTLDEAGEKVSKMHPVSDAEMNAVRARISAEGR